MPSFSSIWGGSIQVFFETLKTRMPAPTIWRASLSPVTRTASQPPSTALRAIVAMMSSAS